MHKPSKCYMCRKMELHGLKKPITLTEKQDYMDRNEKPSSI